MKKLIQLELKRNNIRTYIIACAIIAAFCVLSAVMHSKFIIEDYSGKRPVLLFSYPVGRIKVLLSKLSLVGLFTIISMVASNVLIFSVFWVTEKIIRLVKEEFTFPDMLQAINITLVMAFIAAIIGIVAVGIGFAKKSIPTTIVSAVLMASLMCNVVVNTTSNMAIMYAFGVVMLLVGIIFTGVLIKKINSMEAE